MNAMVKIADADGNPLYPDFESMTDCSGECTCGQSESDGGSESQSDHPINDVIREKLDEQNQFDPEDLYDNDGDRSSLNSLTDDESLKNIDPRELSLDTSNSSTVSRSERSTNDDTQTVTVDNEAVRGYIEDSRSDGIEVKEKNIDLSSENARDRSMDF